VSFPRPCDGKFTFALGEAGEEQQRQHGIAYFVEVGLHGWILSNQILAQRPSFCIFGGDINSRLAGTGLRSGASTRQALAPPPPASASDNGQYNKFD
jgi:hypothetical protein